MDDPFDQGLAAEAVIEPTMAAIPDQIMPSASTIDVQWDQLRLPPAAISGSRAADIAADPIRRTVQVTTFSGADSTEARGNAAVTTGFDQRSASDVGHVPRGDFATPFARAMSAYASR